MTLAQTFRKLNWKGKGIIINGVNITNLRFADNVILFSESEEELNEMIEELIEKQEESGLTLNVEKTKKLSSLEESAQ